MKFIDYIKDKYIEFIIQGFFGAIILLFLSAFRISVNLTIFVVLIYALSSVLSNVWGFFRRKKFYNTLNGNIKSLDKKYLISETLGPPGFYEGELICEILEETNKSMCDNVAEYRRSAIDFREFIEMWVHEIKLPVSSLLLMLHNHKSEMTPKLSRQLRKIDSYTDTVLYYARIDSAEKDYMIKEYSLKKIVSKVIKKYQEDLRFYDVSLNLEIPEICVMTDEKWMEFILGQLLTNSFKYFSSEREAEIRLSAWEEDKKIILSFRDNGIGISSSDLPYIFEKSFTGKNGRTHTRSTGMGLYICRSLCNKMGHGISAVSEEGEFTEIQIKFGNNDFYKF